MKIAYMIGELGLKSETFVTDLIADLPQEGVEVEVFADSIRGECPVWKNIKVSTVPYLRLTSIVDRFLWRFYSDEKRQRLLLAQAKRMLVNSLRESKVDAVFVDFANIGVFCREACEALGLPIVVHVHGRDVTASLSNPSYRKQLKELFQSARIFIAASEHIRRLLVLEGMPADKIRIVRLQPIDYRTVLAGEVDDSSKTKNPSVAFLGRLTPKKCPVALIEAFAIVSKAMPEARLTIIGGGEEQGRVSERVDLLGLKDKVRLCGEMAREDALTELSRHWVYAQHSVTSYSGDQEGFGVSISEAALLEMPVVSTWHNGIKEQVIDGVTGYLVHEYDYEAMADRLLRLLRNPDECQRMGQQGRNIILELCPKGLRAKKIASILKEVTGSPSDTIGAL